MNIGTTNNIKKFKLSLTKQDQNLLQYFEKKGISIDETINSKEIEIYVVESDDFQFLTNDLILYEMVKSKFEKTGYKTTLDKVDFKDFQNSVFVDDDKIDRYWLSGMVKPNLSLIVADKSNTINQFIPMFQERHLDEFKPIYDNQVFFPKELPLMKIFLSVGDNEEYKECKSKETIDRCSEDIRNMIINLKNQKVKF